MSTENSQEKNISTLEGSAKLPVNCSACSKCSDYDEECIDVKDHVRCFLGVNSIGWNIGNADGYCPFVQHCN